MATSRTLHCLFYSHVWSIYQLEALGLIKSRNPLLVELSLEPRFAAVFDQLDKRHKGLAEVLQPGAQLQKLAYRAKHVNTPIILAANPAVSIGTLLAALSVMATVDSPVDEITVLVHINDGAQFADAYAFMSDFSIVWDVADYPNAALVALAESLVNEQCLGLDKWRGFYLSNHPNRQLPDTHARTSILQDILQHFPVLSPV
jgi:hypothetical protein